MKKLEEITIYDEEYDIRVNRYLTVAEIQSISNAVMKYKTWGERQRKIDILLLAFATNLTAEEIETNGIEKLERCGVLDFVKGHVLNYDEIWECIKYTESIEVSLREICKEFPKLQKAVRNPERRNKE